MRTLSIADAIIETAGQTVGLLFSTFSLKLLCLGLCPVALLLMAWGLLR